MARYTPGVKLQTQIPAADIPDHGGPNQADIIERINIDNVPTLAEVVEVIAEADLDNRAIQQIATGGAAQTLDVNSYACIELNLTADCTLTLTDPEDDGMFAFVLYTTEANGGGWDIILPASMLFDGGTQPVPATAPGTITKYVLTARRVSGVTTWDCTMSADGLAV